MALGTGNIQKEIEAIPWFHPGIDRHVAESLLLQNGKNGTYLLRKSSKPGEYALSVRCKNSVKHFALVVKDSQIVFGQGTFSSISELVEHFSNQPLLGGETGQFVVLMTPYPHEVQEPHTYETVVVHAEISAADSFKKQTDFSINSKEGILCKKGGLFKSWHNRWFTLQKNELKYYKGKLEKRAVRVLDLNECLSCKRCFTLRNKPFAFTLEFSWRTFFINASSEQDAEEWVRSINWRLKKDIS